MLYKASGSAPILAGYQGGNGKARATGGHSEIKEVLGGLYLIEAKDYDEAVERTLDHTHLEHGTIELRQLYS